MPTTFSNAIWLARRHMVDQWPAFLITAIYFAFMGGVLAYDDSVTREFAHPILMLILIQPALSSRYMTWKRDNDVVRQQMFLRSLPLSLRTIIVARLTNMLVAGLINVPLYFGMFRYRAEHGLTTPQFLSWCVFWIGFAFIGMGLSLVQEFWLNLRKWTVLNTIIVVAILVLIPVLIWIADFRPVESSFNAAKNHPIVMTVIGLLTSVVGTIVSVIIAERLYRKREFIT